MYDHSGVPEKRIKVELPNVGLVEAVQVPINESTEKWSDVQLGDCTVLRLKPVVISVFRIDGHYDQDGNPVYQIKANQVMAVEAPEHLRKGAGTSSAGVH